MLVGKILVIYVIDSCFNAAFSRCQNKKNNKVVVCKSLDIGPLPCLPAHFSVTVRALLITYTLPRRKSYITDLPWLSAARSLTSKCRCPRSMLHVHDKSRKVTEQLALEAPCSFHVLSTIYSLSGSQGCWTLPRSPRQTGMCPGQSDTGCTHTEGQFRVPRKPYVHVPGLWEGTGAPGEHANPHRQLESDTVLSLSEATAAPLWCYNILK